MGLFDRLLGKKQDESKEKSLMESAGAGLPQDASDIEKAIAGRGRVDLSRYRRISLAEVSALGGSFAQAVPVIQSTITGGTLTNGSIARIVFPEGVTGNLATLNSTGDFIGGILKDEGGFAQARLMPVTMDPAAITTMSMAVMMVQINQKLDAIQKTQQEILSFLQEKERADSQASLNMLEDIMKRYPYNWNNENFRHNYHMKALDIKLAADAKLIIYQKQIAEKIKGLPVVYLDQIVHITMNQLKQLFHDYSMALYLFSFASYLEIMLDGRFVDEDIQLVADKVHNYQENYHSNFVKCQEYFKKFSGGSVESMAIGALANASKGLGKLIATSPVLSQSQVDEWLQDSGDKLQQGNEKRTEKLAQIFALEQKTGSELFEDSIRNVRELSNHVTGMLFDGEYMYLVS